MSACFTNGHTAQSPTVPPVQKQVFHRMTSSASAPTVTHLSWDRFHQDCRALSAQLMHQPWRGVIAIARGGLIPAAIIARELDIRLCDTLCVASYDHDRQGEAKLLKSVDGDGDGFLIVDDLVDTGVTAQLVKNLLPKAKLAVVYAKPQGEALADYWQTRFEQNNWLHFPWDSSLQYAPPLSEQ